MIFTEIVIINFHEELQNLSCMFFYKIQVVFRSRRKKTWVPETEQI